MGVATGFGCKEVYRFPHTTYLYSSCSYLFFFTAASLLFFHKKKCFSFFTNIKVRGLFPLFEKWVNIFPPYMPLPNYLFRHEASLQAVRVHETAWEVSLCQACICMHALCTLQTGLRMVGRNRQE